ncbi:homing endonuclease, partial [Vibrio phage K391]
MLYGEGKTKIGITHEPSERFRKLRERTPFEFESVGIWFCVTYDMTFKVEAVLHRHFEEYSANLKGFDGSKEWFNMASFKACDLLTSFLGAPA